MMTKVPKKTITIRSILFQARSDGLDNERWRYSTVREDENDEMKNQRTESSQHVELLV